VIKEVCWPGRVWAGECFFWYRPTRVVPDKRPLNGCCCWQWCNLWLPVCYSILLLLCLRNVDLSTCIVWQRRVKHVQVTSSELPSSISAEHTTKALALGDPFLKQKGYDGYFLPLTQCSFPMQIQHYDILYYFLSTLHTVRFNVCNHLSRWKCCISKITYKIFRSLLFPKFATSSAKTAI